MFASIFPRLFMKMAPKMDDPVVPGPPQKLYFSKPSLLYRLFTLRACPPTHLHAAQFLRSATYSQRNLLAAQFLLSLANRGGPQGWAKGPKKRAQGPRGGQGAQGAARAARAHGRTRASRAGALRAPGPLRGQGAPLIRNKSYAERNR